MARHPTFEQQITQFRTNVESLAGRRLLLFGGKGGVGKTTISVLAAIHLAASRPVLLVTTDPAGNLTDLIEGPLPNLEIETIDAEELWKRFLETNIEDILELGDRGTLLSRDEIRRFFEFSIPGIDELMGWTRVADLVLENRDGPVIVDTAPTGHTLRLLTSSAHWRGFVGVLESMQAKHHDLVMQLSRREVRDELDAFLESLAEDVGARSEIFSDRSASAFVPVFHAEPWVVDQTQRLITELEQAAIAVPFAIMNRATTGCDCDRCRSRRESERASSGKLPCRIIRAPDACAPFRGIEDLDLYLRPPLHRFGGASRKRPVAAPGSVPAPGPGVLRIGGKEVLFIAGKGGVGKTTVSSSLALQAAASHPDEKIVLLSVDPAHSVLDVFDTIEPPPNLTVEAIDTKRIWQEMSDDIGQAVSDAVNRLTPRGFTNVHDHEITRQLLELSPPGADEIFALLRIQELQEDPQVSLLIVDTAPTGHFLRLLQLPDVAGEWVRELIRLVLNYRDIFSSSTIGEKLLHSSKSLRRFEDLLRSDRSAVIVVTRPEPVVARETDRLLAALDTKQIALCGLVINAVTPLEDCECSRTERASQVELIRRYHDRSTVIVERAAEPPVSEIALRKLVPIEIGG
jgi:arsenite/tail-anchored protein-transporting ATPase